MEFKIVDVNEKELEDALRVKSKQLKCKYILFKVADGKGRESMMALWNHPGSDVTGMVGRCEKVVNTCEKVIII